jgi:hypothetical protein
MKDKFLKLFSIHKEIKFFQLDSIKLAGCGMLKVENAFK